jgi:hypothetical protein
MSSGRDWPSWNWIWREVVASFDGGDIDSLLVSVSLLRACLFPWHSSATPVNEFDGKPT